jgi:hypothetical protein
VPSPVAVGAATERVGGEEIPGRGMGARSVERSRAIAPMVVHTDVSPKTPDATGHTGRAWTGLDRIWERAERCRIVWRARPNSASAFARALRRIRGRCFGHPAARDGCEQDVATARRRSGKTCGAGSSGVVG